METNEVGKKLAASLDIGLGDSCAVCGEKVIREAPADGGPGIVLCMPAPEMANGLSFVCNDCGAKLDPALLKRGLAANEARHFKKRVENGKVAIENYLRAVSAMGTILHFNAQKDVSWMGARLVSLADKVDREFCSWSPDYDMPFRVPSEDEIPF